MWRKMGVSGCVAGTRGGKWWVKIPRNFVCLSQKKNRTHIWPSGSAIQIEKTNAVWTLPEKKLPFEKFQGVPTKKSGPGVLGIGKNFAVSGTLRAKFPEKKNIFPEGVQGVSKKLLGRLKKCPGNILQDQKN